MTHGGGGRAMAQLIEELFASAFGAGPGAGNDSAVLDLPAGARLVVSTDGFVVSPLEFPGGDIGSLAVHGTVNDVAMSGAVPLHLTAGFILEEGLELALLARLVRSMAAAARAAEVTVVAGDTKVVERGKGDGVFITTTGIGIAPAGPAPSGDRARPGDILLLSGSIGEHGIAILAARGEMPLEVPVVSDGAALHGLVAAMLAAAPREAIRCLRDPTRGGLAATANEIADQSGVGLLLREAAIPVAPAVAAACELLGLDPLHLANEGKLLAVVAPEHAPTVLEAMRAHPLGRQAAAIGEVVADAGRQVRMDTTFGGRRMVDWLAGEQQPRIC
jgi:hydrogenase expression/formation protein HypE